MKIVAVSLTLLASLVGVLWVIAAPEVPGQNPSPVIVAATTLKIDAAFTSADGKTVTVVIGGAELTSAQNITGFTFQALPLTSAAPFEVGIAGSSVEGNNIRFTLEKPLLAGQIVSLDVANSNLSAGNTKLPAISNLNVDQRSTLLAAEKGETEVNSALVRIPAGSLDKWRNARGNAKNEQVELVLFGDSTAFGSSGSPVVPWIYRVRALSVEAGYYDGGRGNVSWADSMLKAAPIEPADTAPGTVVSKKGFDGSGIPGVASVTYFDSKTTGDSITLQGHAEQIRLHFQRSWASGVLSYAVDGGEEIEVSAFDPTSLRPDALLITGLPKGRHTITITNKSAPPIVAPSDLEIKVKADNNPKAPAAGTYYYGLTAVNDNGESAITKVLGPVGVNGKQTPEVVTTFGRGWKGLKLYRATSKDGPFGLVKTFLYAPEAGRRFGISDEEGVAPGAPPPQQSTLGLLSEATNLNIGVDWMFDKGIVYHRNADSGATFGSYDFDDKPIQVHGKPGHLALGLAPQDGPYVVDERPPHRRPTIALSALGINNQQGGQLDAGRVALGTKNFIERARAAGAEPVVIIPHYLHSNSPATYAPFVAAQKNIANAYGVPWFSFDVALDQAGYRVRDGKTPGDPHLDQKGYDIEAHSIWDNLLNTKK